MNMARSRGSEDLVMFALEVDRRLLLLDAIRGQTAFRVSEVVGGTGRSLQNLSRAARELEAAGVLRATSPGKRTWKRYVVTARGQRLLGLLAKRGWVRVPPAGRPPARKRP